MVELVVFGNLNLNHTGIIESKHTTAVMAKGNCGEKFFHNKLPINGAGNDIMPRLVLNKPKAVPRKWAGTDLLIKD